MVTVAQAVQVLFPNAKPLIDFRVENNGSGEAIAYWNAAIGTQPTAPQLAAVTDQQWSDLVTSGHRAAAIAQADLPDKLGKLVKAICGVIADELNILRGQVVGVVTFSWDPANLADAAGLTRADIAVTGAAFGDAVDVLAPYTLAGVLVTAYVHSAGIVGVRIQNESGGAVNFASGNWTVIVRRPIAMAPRTLLQAKNAIIAKLNSGDAD